MEQPKYKIGESVKTTGGKVFVILGVSTWKDRPVMYYPGETSIGYREDQVELYQEPQKKKLYAYEYKKDGAVIHYSKEWVNHRDNKTTGWVRTPEYDLEYPDA